MANRAKIAPLALPALAAPQSVEPAATLLAAPSLAQAEKLVGVPALAGAPENNIVAWEQVRVLRTRLQGILRERNLRTLLVASAVAGEGKTLVAANLALSFSQLERKRVLLVDADLRRPGLSGFFGQRPAAGLSDCLANGHRLTDVVVTLGPQLDLLPTVPAFERSVELLNHTRMRELVTESVAGYDLVVIDSAPLGPIADTQVLTRLVDAAVLVVRAGLAPFPLVRQAAELLQPKLVGAVLNAAEHVADQDYSYRYYYRAREQGDLR